MKLITAGESRSKELYSKKTDFYFGNIICFFSFLKKVLNTFIKAFYMFTLTHSESLHGVLERLLRRGNLGRALVILKKTKQNKTLNF